jgi:purine-nucleoside phosphorylase
MKVHIEEAVDYIKRQGVESCNAAIVLGTGLSGLVKEIDIICQIPYDTIPHFVTSTVEFHAGKLIYGHIADKKVIAMQGRFHFYEGYTMQQITFPVRVMAQLGIQYMLLSNAAGAINPHFKKGQLMLITDHINLFPDNPLIGKNDNTLGTRFVDMSCPYSKSISNSIKNIAAQNNISLVEGIYAGVTGPNLETRAEYRFLRAMGSDAVGMSTIPEVIVCNHAGIPCAAVSVLTDECDPDNLHAVNIEDIINVAMNAEPNLTLLFKNIIANI